MRIDWGLTFFSSWRGWWNFPLIKVFSTSLKVWVGCGVSVCLVSFTITRIIRMILRVYPAVPHKRKNVSALSSLQKLVQVHYINSIWVWNLEQEMFSLRFYPGTSWKSHPMAAQQQREASSFRHCMQVADGHGDNKALVGAQVALSDLFLHHLEMWCDQPSQHLCVQF